uniref:Replication protein A OB domain-containing protein n=1 Tax=Amphimedon queenslandica TaxID=400682 RepID=A0A1X7U2L1_AMPQE
MAKRQREDDTSQQSAAAENPEITCMIQSLSPMKKSKKGNDYYTGVCSDGNKSMRIIGFDSHSNEQLLSYKSKGETVAIKNCTVKTGPSEEIELFINRTSKIEYSPKKIDVKPIVVPDKTIPEILALEDGVIVNVTAKVLSAELPRSVSRGLVQDVVLTDGHNTIDLSVWEENTNKLEPLKSYNFESLYTRSYRGTRTLTLSRQSTFTLTDHITEVEPDDEKIDIVIDAKIVGVQNFCIHISCINCRNNLPLSTTFSQYLRCSNCSVLQSIYEREYDVTTNLIVVGRDDPLRNMKACKDIIVKILQIEDSALGEEMEESLLRTPKMDILFSERSNYVKDIKFK